MAYSRRQFMGVAGGALTAATTFAALPGAGEALAVPFGSGSSGSSQTLGTLVDYARGVPSAQAIRAAGHVGVIRYVSDRRPGAEYMIGKPLKANEVADLRANGMSIVSNYQFGKGNTADWLGGFAAGVKHATRGQAIHAAAGGPAGAPIYASIDDNPSQKQIAEKVIPYLRGWASVIGGARVGVYANSPTIDKVLAANAAAWFWQHNWGSPKGYVHPAAAIHQFKIDSDQISGVGVDLNNILKPQYGQW